MRKRRRWRLFGLQMDLRGHLHLGMHLRFRDPRRSHVAPGLTSQTARLNESFPDGRSEPIIPEKPWTWAEGQAPPRVASYFVEHLLCVADDALFFLLARLGQIVEDVPCLGIVHFRRCFLVQGHEGVVEGAGDLHHFVHAHAGTGFGLCQQLFDMVAGGELQPGIEKGTAGVFLETLQHFLLFVFVPAQIVESHLQPDFRLIRLFFQGFVIGSYLIVEFFAMIQNIPDLFEIFHDAILRAVGRLGIFCFGAPKISG
ncbi:hypothetical protein MCA2630 [Methylococcus capsulatus str. Bath]|uniref:Uncharacterized protein n=1 Tax=Methylococcus capsulatus (strain ATCC 33009 / NCIMB 11132 / Bath) TaxID=243233 RepID=Q604B6_METCA|nr:hypothetical protein MCA2630 [Methylococcus capsulatus str. Bath]